ncbi:copper chaperone PCu(A)C [Aurantiacibacter xanthus]|uniref:Copper chaperone PCu(A)C n=1 Tax=Aurantiacibacter xanthus TaxID=1784712 RepID=A0A3A1PE84_9SPHN|nr:copper chaperone PCu(A)C [Aurantiacibacter xanthus]RIV91901.1 copper chaperone PCu(A)C [Aurantiacibacter xanthus]
MTKKTLAATFAALALALGTAACSGSDENAAATSSPDAPAGISVTDGRLSLPAVKGNPAAVYFTIRNVSEEPVTIRAVTVAGAGSAQLHETTEYGGKMDMQELVQVPVQPGGEVVFEQAGKHVMAFDLDDDLAPGGETEVTLTFVNGDKVSFPAKLMAPGTADMDHSAMEGM